MNNKTMIAMGIAMAVAALPVVADEEGSLMDEWEISGELKNESAVFTKDGQTIGQATTRTDTSNNNDSGDLYKSESTARIFINGDVGDEGSTFHAELNLRNDGEAISGYKGSKSYTQHDILRELYIDTELGEEENPVAIRAGKQQVVWGTADGIKLLDIINPTDWREFAQNTMEDSRIPVWMLNAEADLESGGNVQLILSQAEENKIPGLSSSGDQGQPFVMKGVDTITGKVHGFLNVAPAMGKVAAFFTAAASGGDDTHINLYNNYNGATVQEFAENIGADPDDFGGLDGCNGGGVSANCLYNVANDSDADTNFGGGHVQGSNGDVTNLIDADNSSDTSANWSVSDPNSVFEYMGETAFATFYSFSDMTSTYKKDYPDDSALNIGTRFKKETDSGLNYSVNYLYSYDTNPYVDIHWEDQSGNNLTVDYESVAAGSGTCGNQTCTSEAGTVVRLLDSDGSQHLITESTGNLVFTEKLNRIHNVGAAFDYAIDTEETPVVVRGEFLYQKDVMTPVISKAALNIGDLVGGLQNEKADFFKYVVGADITVMTNLMLSGQFIQMRNLDYIDETHTPSQNGQASHVSGVRYTGDMATLHLTNGLQKAEENKEFYSFFMSKPFGAEQQHRWNNIFMYEENGGKWDRFDVEYSFNDELIGLAEYNKYWGDANTQFGQMEKSSNFQLGLKYIF